MLHETPRLLSLRSAALQLQRRSLQGNCNAAALRAVAHMLQRRCGPNPPTLHRRFDSHRATLVTQPDQAGAERASRVAYLRDVLADLPHSRFAALSQLCALLREVASGGAAAGAGGGAAFAPRTATKCRSPTAPIQ